MSELNGNGGEHVDQATAVFHKTLRHFFPSFQNWLGAIPDPRVRGKVTYSLPYLLWIGILMFGMKLHARRQINFNFDTPEFIANLALLTGEDVGRIPHHDTLAYALKRLEPEYLSSLRRKMVNGLIRQKCLASQRLLETYYTIAIDGTGYLSFSERHCPYCLEEKLANGRIRYYHPVLEAKLLLPNGLAFSIETEFIENSVPGAEKQDCELTAFYRLAARLKKRFPQLRICILMDALFDNSPVFNLCTKFGWKYMITFKEGAMPAVYQDYRGLTLLEQNNTSTVIKDTVTQKFQWVNEVECADTTTNVLECEETKPGVEAKTFVWATNLPVNKDNHQLLAQRGGRLRWKIENEGFNLQKNGGLDPIAIMNFYLLLQIAHILNQLMEKGSLIKGSVQKVFGSIRNFARRLLESFRTKILHPAQLQSLLAAPFQVRFNSS